MSTKSFSTSARKSRRFRRSSAVCPDNLKFAEIARMTGPQFVIATVHAAIVLASSAAQTAPVKQGVPFAARPLPLSAVRVTGGPLKHAQELDAEYLLKLD